MKAIGFFLLLLVWHPSFSQFTESFQDGNLTSNPSWSGSTSNFSVVNQALVLSATPEQNTSFLITSSEAVDNAAWEFTVQMDFNPSSSNYAEVYLVSDNSDLNASLNGYIIRVGWSSDNISLLRQDGTEKSVLISGFSKRLDSNSVEVIIRVTRTSFGEWQLYSKLNTEPDWFFEGEVQDLIYNQSQYFGLRCIYTSTRSDKFLFDDLMVIGDPFVDTDPPAIDTVFSVSDTKVNITFSEEILASTAIADNFLLNDAKPISLEVDEATVILEFRDSLEIENQLQLKELSDYQGNLFDSLGYEFIHYSFQPARFGDIVFNELMPDPSPPEDLPEVEYVEIHNSSEKAILMTNWSLMDNITDVILPEIRLMPDSILVLYKKTTGLTWATANSLEITNWPSLNNLGDDLQLVDSTGRIIDQLSYCIQMFGDESKRDGGWSLERVDPYLPCTGETNWKVSVDSKGGTPGEVNSVFERINDQETPFILGAYAHSVDSISVYFSEFLGTIPESISIAEAEVFEFYLNPEDRSKLTIRSSSLLPRKEYALEIMGASDCVGNRAESLQAIFVLPEVAEHSDLVINEILFNPVNDKYDYIELYNPSPKYIDIAQLYLSNGESSVEITNSEIIGPGDYRLLTKEPDEILNSYQNAPPHTLVQQNLPSYTNESGIAVIKSSIGLVIDSIRYDEDWHFAYLNSFDGIALERISPLRSGLTKSNWASASSQNNYGTPGYQNSQSSAFNSTNQIAVEPKVIIPNNNGRDDFTKISINSSVNALITIRVYNILGMEIRMLANNSLASGTSYFIWDGTDGQGNIVPLGHYIIVADLIMENGKSETYREKMVVGTGY